MKNRNAVSSRQVAHLLTPAWTSTTDPLQFGCYSVLPLFIQSRRIQATCTAALFCLLASLILLHTAKLGGGLLQYTVVQYFLKGPSSYFKEAIYHDLSSSIYGNSAGRTGSVYESDRESKGNRIFSCHVSTVYFMPYLLTSKVLLLVQELYLSCNPILISN